MRPGLCQSEMNNQKIKIEQNPRLQPFFLEMILPGQKSHLFLPTVRAAWACNRLQRILLSVPPLTLAA